jgi:hypothetical protein
MSLTPESQVPYELFKLGANTLVTIWFDGGPADGVTGEITYAGNDFIKLATCRAFKGESVRDFKGMATFTCLTRKVAAFSAQKSDET